MRVVLSGRLTTVAIGTEPVTVGQSRVFPRGDREAAIQFIRGFTHDTLNRAALRRLLAHEGVSVARIDDGELAIEVATRLANGRLFILDVRAPSATPVPPRPEPTPQPAPEPVRPATTAPAARAPAEAETEEPTFAQIDQDEQAAVLEQAAAEGVPFCEECERLEQEAAATSTA